MDKEPSLEKILRDAACMSLGIIPLNYQIHDGIKERLNSLPPEEARKMKRKFRKLWRKVAKQRSLSTSVGLGDKLPAKSAMRRRKDIVRSEIVNKFVNPTLNKMIGNNK